MNIYEGIALIIALFTAFTLIVQTTIVFRTLKADHERRKKQATIEFVQRIRPMWLEARHLIEQRWGKESLNEKELKELDENYELMVIVRNMLGHFEHLSVGMNSGVYDKDLLFRTSGSFLINIHHRMSSYIDRARRNLPNAYIEFSDLVADYEERIRKKPSTKGNIIYS